MRISDWSSDVCSSDLICRSSGTVTVRPAATSASTFFLFQPDCASSRAVARPSASPTRTHPWLKARTSRSNSDCAGVRSEEHTSELQSLMRNSYAVFCLKKKTTKQRNKKQNKQQTKRQHTDKTKQ